MANIFIIVFIAGMTYWWGSQGVFSALLHLLCVIVAGALAFALWEPITMNLLLPHVTGSAWGIGLLLPFAIILLILRVTMDHMVKTNVQFSMLVNFLAGGTFGLLAGILTAGITIIGLGHLDLGPDLGGYQPWVLDGQGNVTKNPESGLWIEVDEHAADFYAGLSGGEFYSRHPLKQYRPNVHHMASFYRMHPDRYASLGVAPGGVTVSGWYRADAPLTNEVDDAVRERMGGKAKAAGNELIIVETTWNQLDSNAYDADGTLRVAQAQIRLLATPTESTNVDKLLYEPIGVARGQQDDRRYLPLNDPDFFAYGNSQQETFAWAFLVPKGREPKFVFARNVRLPVPGEANVESDAIRAALGELEPQVITAEAPPEGVEGEIGERTGLTVGSQGVEVKLTNELPAAVSRNMATTLSADRADDTAIAQGDADARRPPGGVSRELRYERIATPSHRAMVRVKLERDEANHWLGAARAAAASLQTIQLSDDQGNHWQPGAYVWHRQNGSQQISVNFGSPIRSPRELPVREMENGDTLYLYFLVNRGTVIERYSVGDMVQEVQLTVP